MTHANNQKYIEKTVKAIVYQGVANKVLCKVVLTSKGAYVIPVKEREEKVVH
jgi:hypothetical protein